MLPHNPNQAQNGRGEKRPIKAVADGDVDEPEAKRAALNNVSHDLLNFLLDLTKESLGPFDERARLLAIKHNVRNFSIDPKCGKDTVTLPNYADDIFNHFKLRQMKFPIKDYMKTQRYISADMRGVLINWLVNVQLQFVLDHETLYLAVKIIDIYLSRTQSEILRGDLQLLGAAAILLAAKFERSAPLIDVILNMCEEKYNADEIIKMEIILFKTVGFDLGIPISYRFLRRFACVVELDMRSLNLAFYILETSLMFYQFVGIKDDLMAAASLLLALRMKNRGYWNAELVKYSGYTLGEVEPLMKCLNHMIVKYRADYDRLDIIFNKYSHEFFFEVAKIPSLDDEFILNDPIGPPPALSFD